MQTTMKKDEDKGDEDDEDEDDTYEDYGDEDDGDDTNGDSYQWQTPMTDVAVKAQMTEDINVGNSVDKNANDEHH